MKKWIVLFLILSLVMSMSVSAFAAEIDQDSEPKTADVTVATSIGPTYTVTIPGDMQVQFNQTSTRFGTIKLTAAQINPGYAVEVTLSASGELKNTADKTRTIAYTVNSGDGVFSSKEYQKEGTDHRHHPGRLGCGLCRGLFGHGDLYDYLRSGHTMNRGQERR